MADRTAADVRLCDLLHFDGCLYAGRDAKFFERILQSDGIDDGREHAHVVSRRTVHPTLAALETSPDIAATYNDSDLDTGIAGFLDLASQSIYDLRIDTKSFVAGHRFTRQFQHDSLILLVFCCHCTPP